MLDNSAEFNSTAVARELARNAGFRSVREHIDTILSSQFGIMPLSGSTAAVTYGFNHRNLPISYEPQRDNYGYTFFSRPNLTLSPTNCMKDRRLAMLLTKDRLNVQSWLRYTLYPGAEKNEGQKCPLVNNNHPWIPLLSNSVVTLSGWPGLNASLGTTSPDRFGSSVNFIDGAIKELRREYNLSVNFRNMQGNFALSMFFYWLYAATLFQLGILMPDPKDLVDCSKNYDTRIIRFVMDPMRKYIIDWCAAETAVIESVPKGESYNLETAGVYNSSHDEFTIGFRCQGYSAVDPIILREFNDNTVNFNKNMEDGRRESSYVQVPQAFLNQINGEGYPWVDLKTLELQWWIEPERYIELMERYTNIRGAN